MIPNILEIDYEQENYYNIYNEIYENIDMIINNFFEILDPKTNAITKMHLLNGFSKKDAYTLSFMSTLMIYCKI